MKGTKVVSIDPAPSKDAVIFDGEFHKIAASNLVQYCSELANDKKTNILLCWDAPLTGPASESGSFSQRTIEKFFSCAKMGFKAPPGISVLPYCGCPHWAITRACLGLPYCGRFDMDIGKLPFRLICDIADVRRHNCCVIETHPALAIWLWCRSTENRDNNSSWAYKGKKPARTIGDLWILLTQIWNDMQVDPVTDTINNIRAPENDDELDAFVGWVLGTLLVAGESSVGILGDLKTGAIALPMTSDLKKSFQDFCTCKKTNC